MSDKHAELLEAYRKEPSKRVGERMLAVIHVLVDGEKIAVVARRLRRSYNSVKNWCNKFTDKGIKDLYDAPRTGRPPKIDNETLDKYIGDTSVGVDLRILRDEVREVHGVDYSESGLRAKAHSMGWSYKKPQPAFYRRADIEYAAAWAYGIMPDWLAELEKDGFDACVVDQKLVRNDFDPVARMWSAIGTPIYRYKYPTRSQFYLFGGFTRSGRQLFRNIGKYTAENVLRVLKEMYRQWGRFGLVLDRAPQHTACAVTDWMADHLSDIRVQWFPTAWSELDAVEGYWSKLARHPVMNQVFDTVDERVKAIMNVVRTMKANLDIKKTMCESPLVVKKPGCTTYYELESISEEPPSPAEIQRCKDFLA